MIHLTFHDLPSKVSHAEPLVAQNLRLPVGFAIGVQPLKAKRAVHGLRPPERALRLFTGHTIKFDPSF